MPDAGNSMDSRQEFDRILLRDYYDAVERGETPGKEDLIAKHPTFAEELKSFFADVRNMNAAFGEPRPTLTSNIPFDDPTRGNSVIPDSGAFIRDYQLLRKIGEGGMGTVYLAMHTQLEKRVAIKVLRGDRESDTKRFQKEIRAVGLFEHEHVVRALDAGKVNSLHYLVMEFIDGVDLSQLLAHCPSIAIPEACELARQAALGIAHAHQHGLIHRDIKPSNLMLTSTWHVKLLDLGLAQLQQPFRQSTALTADGQAMGTLKYMAPEQFADCKNVDATCDVYSLGVTLFELLYGELPTSGTGAVIDCQSLQQTRSDISDDLIELIRLMTSEQPSQRIQNVSEVANRLATWSDGHDLAALFTRYDHQNRQSIHPPAAPTVPRTPATVQAVADANGRWMSSKLMRRILLFAGLFLIALTTSILFRPRASVEQTGISPPPPIAEATLEVIFHPDSRLDQRLGFEGVIIDTSSGDAHRLAEGTNQLALGSYEMELGGWTSSIQSPIQLSAS